MKKRNAGVLVVGVSIFLIAQVAVGQTGTPQPSQQPNEVKQVHPRKQPQQRSQLQQQQSQSQQTQPQQQRSRQPALEDQPSPPPPLTQGRKQPMQKHTQSIHRSTPPPTLMSFEAAQQRCQREHHPRDWWTQRYPIIVLVGGGYYYFDSGYWFPAWGYNSNYESYDYDGPIYTYGNLLPDQVILNVQRALTDLGYFAGVLSGALSPATRSAISAYQQDNGLVVNGVVDAPLVYSLGLQ
jgi:hypothetical protein